MYPKPKERIRKGGQREEKMVEKHWGTAGSRAWGSI
jgi:hypothetical protein